MLYRIDGQFGTSTGPWKISADSAEDARRQAQELGIAVTKVALLSNEDERPPAASGEKSPPMTEKQIVAEMGKAAALDVWKWLIWVALTLAVSLSSALIYKVISNRPSIAKARLETFAQRDFTDAGERELPRSFGIERNAHYDPVSRSGSYEWPTQESLRNIGPLQYERHTFHVSEHYDLNWRAEEPFRASMTYQVSRNDGKSSNTREVTRVYKYENGTWKVAD